MANKNRIWIIAILAIIFCWYLLQLHRSVKQPEIASNSNTQAPIANLMATQSSTSVKNINDSSTNDIERRYHQGLISREEAFREAYLEQNKQSQDFYGKVLDQYGEPIMNANVSANLIANDETSGGLNVQKCSTVTDNNGLFEFTGIYGADINVLVSKEGYKYGERGEGYKGSIGGKTSPTDRAILTMWKLRGAEPLNSSGIDAKIPHDGTPITFEMSTGKQSSNGDMRVSLSQFPLDVSTGRERFDWSVKAEVINGGLLEENDPYPYWAPANGYQPIFEFGVSSNATAWVPNLKKKFYIKNSQGQYGIMQFNIYPGRSPTGLEASFTINPSGSQNLEPDFSK
jgi:hypothetical protein